RSRPLPPSPSPTRSGWASSRRTRWPGCTATCWARPTSAWRRRRLSSTLWCRESHSRSREAAPLHPPDGRPRMTRKIATVFLVLAAGCSRPIAKPDRVEVEPDGAFSVTIRDDLGRTVTVSGPPRRIVSLAPGITETLFAVGAGPQLVAVTTTDTHPPEVKQLPTVGGFAPETISLEVLLAQKPDLVIAGGRFQQPIVESVAKLGVSAVVIDPNTLAGVEDAIVLIGRLTGQEAKSAAVIADFRRRREAVRRRTAAIKPADRLRVLYVLWDEPLQTAGPDTFVGQMITEAGGV